MGKRAATTFPTLSIGRNIKRFRVAEGLTLKELARRSGVSIATISKIENDKISGGFETIYKIARGLGILVTEIITTDFAKTERIVLHKKNEADVHETAIYDYYPQAFRHDGALNPYLMVIHTRKKPPKRDWSIHEGEEVVIVLSGMIDLHLEGQKPLKLGTGDSACFDCGVRHAFVSVGDHPAHMISVSTRGPATRNGGRLVYSRRV